MESSEDAATATKCFSAILSRLLCYGSPPTHPSDHLPQLTSTVSTHQPQASKTESNHLQAPTNSTPGIVARLMGLDPFPDTTSVPKTRTLESILRSRSANYVDYYLPRLDIMKQPQKGAQDEAHDQARHRRVKTSVSFRDVPTFLNPQNHDLLLHCLDQVDEISRKSELGLKEMARGENIGSGREKVSLKKSAKEEKNKQACKRKEEEVTNGPSSRPKLGIVLGQKRDVHSKPRVSLKGKCPEKRIVNRQEISAELKATRKRKNENKGQNSNSKSSSGLRDSPLPVRAPIISENSGTMGLTSRKISSLKYDHSTNFKSRVKDDDRVLRAIKSKTNMPLKTKENYHLVVDMLIEEVCRLAEEELKRGAVWIARNDLKLFEEICLEFEQETLEILLYQLVDELCGSSLDLGLNLS